MKLRNSGFGIGSLTITDFIFLWFAPFSWAVEMFFTKIEVTQYLFDIRYSLFVIRYFNGLRSMMPNVQPGSFRSCLLLQAPGDLFQFDQHKQMQSEP